MGLKSGELRKKLNRLYLTSKRFGKSVLDIKIFPLRDDNSNHNSLAVKLRIKLKRILNKDVDMDALKQKQECEEYVSTPDQLNATHGCRKKNITEVSWKQLRTAMCAITASFHPLCHVRLIFAYELNVKQA